MANYDLTSLAVKMLCPNNEVIVDDAGYPSIMVKVPKFKVSDVIDGGSSSTHPAFIVDGKEVPAIYISKYQNVIHNGRGYSLPGEDPAVRINFDTARQCCESKGAGWHLMTNAEWAAIALWCRKNGHMPYGNNYYGKDTRESNYKAIEKSKDTNYPDRTGRVATGTGPITWSHDKTISGIWDLNGNVWEWLGGYRTVDGEIQIIENNNAANPSNPQNSTSKCWRAILPSGSLVAPGSSGTLKWDYTSDSIETDIFKEFQLKTSLQYKQTDTQLYGRNTIETITATNGVNVPDLLKELALWPVDSDSYDGDSFYMRNTGERLALRGGGRGNGSHSGVFALYGGNVRTSADGSMGFRAAYIPEIG